MKLFCEHSTERASNVRLILCILGLLLWLSPPANAAQLNSARVTRIIKDVKLLPSRAAARAAAVNDPVTAGTSVRTGVESRTELTFSDLTITRLGANTIFSFNGATRQVELGNGAMLVEIPPGAPEVNIHTAAVTAGVTGGTALFESNKGLPTKLLIMEGRGRFFPNGHPELEVIVHGGEMVMMLVNGQITRPEKFNARLVLKTSKLITSFPALPNMELMLVVIDQQQTGREDSSFHPANTGNEVDKTDQAVSAGDTTTTSSGGGSSAKFGPPSTITSPDPYLITSGTVINTDPTITTNGKTDFGKIYRGQAQ